MAEILIKIKIEDNSNALAFVERTQPYLSKTHKEIRQDIVSEVGELLPQNFKSVRTGIPVCHCLYLPNGWNIRWRTNNFATVSRGFRKHKDLAFVASKFRLLQEYHLLLIWAHCLHKKMAASCRGGQSVARLCEPLLLLPSCCGKSRIPLLHYCTDQQSLP